MRWYRCPAKINLRLDVGPVAPDGYHPVVTVLAALDLHDDLGMAARPGPMTLEVEDAHGVPVPDLGPVDDNLVLRAARAFLDSRGKPREGVGFRLRKRIPARAGLGGGSADAAGALVALRDLHAPGVPTEESSPLASRLGADVSFALEGGVALARGRGERLEAVPGGLQLPLLLMKPEDGIATGPAYAALDDRGAAPGFDPEAGRDGAAARLAAAWSAGDPGTVLACLGNDFDAVAAQLAPGVEGCRRVLEDAGAAAVLLAGSGSAVAGVFSTGALRDQAASAVGASPRGWGPVAADAGGAGIQEFVSGEETGRA